MIEPVLVSDDARPVADVLRDLWCGLLGSEDVADEHKFFPSGGNSLTAARLVATLRKKVGVDVPFGLVLDNVSFGELVAYVSAEGSPRTRTVSAPVFNPAERQPSPGDDEYPVLPRVGAALARQRWAVENGYPAALFSTGCVVRVRGSLDLDRLRVALAGVLRKHDALRMVFRAGGNGFVSEPDPRYEADITVLETPQAVEEPLRAVVERTFAPFEMAEAPKARIVVTRSGSGEHLVGIGVCHLVCDGIGLDIVVRDLQRFYSEADDAGPGNYHQYLKWYEAWLESEEAAADREYWMAKIGTGKAFPGFALPGASAGERQAGVPSTYVECRVPPVTVTRLRSAALDLAASPFTIFAAAVSTVALGYGVPDLAFLTPSDARVADDIDEIVCWHNNMALLRPGAAPDMSFRELVASLRRDVAEAIAHSLFPFQQVALDVSPEQVLRPRQGVSLMVGCELDRTSRLNRLGESDAEELMLYGTGSALGFDVWLRSRGESAFVSVAHDAGLLAPGRAEDFGLDVVDTLHNLCASPERPLVDAAGWLRGAP